MTDLLIGLRPRHSVKASEIGRSHAQATHRVPFLGLRHSIIVSLMFWDEVIWRKKTAEPWPCQPEAFARVPMCRHAPSFENNVTHGVRSLMRRHTCGNIEKTCWIDGGAGWTIKWHGHCHCCVFGSSDSEVCICWWVGIFTRCSLD